MIRQRQHPLTTAAFSIIMGATVLFSAPTPTSAQSFNEFSVHDTKQNTQQKCKELGGIWIEMPTEVLPKHPVRVTSGAACKFTDQIMFRNDDDSIALIRPKHTTFLFDHSGLVESAVFSYAFKTWSARDFAKRSLKKHMNKYFVLTATKIRTDFYKLNNTDFFLEFIHDEYKDGMYLGIAISRETIETYTGAAAARKQTEEDTARCNKLGTQDCE